MKRENNFSDQNFRCKDYLVSGREFEIIPFKNGILKTSPIPEDLSEYYNSPDYISHKDSPKNLQDRIYHFVKSFMLSKKATWIEREIKQGAILDFGAGTGDFLKKMKSRSWVAEGVEPNDIARKQSLLKNISLKKELSELENKKFDIITLWHVLEHLPDLEEKILKFKSLLKENGILIIAVPNYQSYDAKYYKENWAAWDVPRHIWHFSKVGITQLFENYGFFLLKEKPLKFDSFYVSLLSEKNRPATTSIGNAIFRGAISNYKAKKTGEYSSIAYFFKNSPNN